MNTISSASGYLRSCLPEGPRAQLLETGCAVSFTLCIGGAGDRERQGTLILSILNALCGDYLFYNTLSLSKQFRTQMYFHLDVMDTLQTLLGRNQISSLVLTNHTSTYTLVSLSNLELESPSGLPSMSIWNWNPFILKISRFSITIVSPTAVSSSGSGLEEYMTLLTVGICPVNYSIYPL